MKKTVRVKYDDSFGGVSYYVKDANGKHLTAGWALDREEARKMIKKALKK